MGKSWMLNSDGIRADSTLWSYGGSRINWINFLQLITSYATLISLRVIGKTYIREEFIIEFYASI